ncbi:UNVERIFIED_ORG: hypothetical protein GGD48_004902 [Rhizobium etli]
MTIFSGLLPRKPIAALSELIGNAYDADAREVKIELEEGPLARLGVIRVIDNGTGIPADDVETFFQSLGGSWKRRARKTDTGRSINGEKGQGRFKAFALGDRVTWVSHLRRPISPLKAEVVLPRSRQPGSGLSSRDRLGSGYAGRGLDVDRQAVPVPLDLENPVIALRWPWLQQCKVWLDAVGHRIEGKLGLGGITPSPGPAAERCLDITSRGLGGLRGGFVTPTVQQQRLKKQLPKIDY